MRVALLSMNARAGDAVGRQVAEMAAYFLDRGAAVDVVVQDTRNLHPALKPYTHIHAHAETTGPGWKALSRADLLVVEFTQFYPLLELVPLLVDGRRKLIIDYQGVTPPADAPANLRAALLRGEEWRGLMSLADATIVHSRFTARELGSIRCHRMPLAVDSFRFAPAPPQQSLRQRLNVSNAPIVLFVGRVAPNKRLPTLIRALAECRDLGAHLAVVGPCHDAYEAERLNCEELAADLGIAERVHYLGAVSEDVLLDAYRSADALVIPSRHEGFGLPAVEAMACGLPVLVARAGALPETVGAAGLTFAVDDATDLARQLRRLLASSGHETKKVERIAVVMSQHGNRAGGAERSLTRLAHSLHDAGYGVEVFTTGNDAESTPYPVNLFPAANIDAGRREAAIHGLADEPQYWQNTLRSPELVAALTNGSFDAVFVGPYLNGLTRDTVRAMGSRTILVPCLHDEPQAHLNGVQAMFDAAGAVLYHSAAERELAHAEFGYNHVNEAILGTFIDTNLPADAERGKNRVGCDRYLVYCGRMVAEKNVQMLFDYASRYDRDHPNRVRFAFMGNGPLATPCEPWARRLGFVDEAVKRDVLAGALALVQPSANESLSLAVLEANAVGTPVFVNTASPVLTDYVAESRGGWFFTGYEDFARHVNALIDYPHAGAELGAQGRDYVAKTFGNQRELVARIEGVVQRLGQPLNDALRENGQRRVAELSRANWRREFGRVVDMAMENERPVAPPSIELSARETTITGTVWTLHVTHRGGRPLAPSGPGRSEVVTRIRHIDGEVLDAEWATPFNAWVQPGITTIHVHLPVIESGPYVLEAGLRHHGLEPHTEWFGPMASWTPIEFAPDSSNGCLRRTHCDAPALALPLEKARAIQDLPDGYVDVTCGFAARIKRWLKHKLLHNLRVSYLDVLSRQQSRFNRQVLDAVEATAGVPHDDATLRRELAEVRRRCEALERRLERLSFHEFAERQEAA